MHKALVIFVLLSVAYGYPAVENTKDDNVIEKIYRPSQTDTEPKKQEAESEETVDAAVDTMIDHIMKYLILTNIQSDNMDPAKEEEDSEELSDAAIEAVMEEFFKLLNTTEEVPEEDQERVILEMFKKLDELLTNFEQNELDMIDRENKDALNKNPGSEDDQNAITNTTPEVGTTEIVPEIVTTT